MFLHVIEAKYINGYKIWAKFNDGTSGEIDLSSDLDEGIFKQLKEIKYFMNFSLEGHTLSWENGADFAPEYLRKKLN